MKNIIEEIFFFLHEQIEKLNSIFNSKITPLILAPLLPFSVVIISIIQLSDGVFILFNSIVIFMGIIFTFLLGASSFYFYKNENIYTIIKRKKSNKNLSQFQSNSNMVNFSNEKNILEILEKNKDKIRHYYFELRKIDVFEFDTSLNDFTNLISNCFNNKSSDCYAFNLEISAYHTHYFIREFLIPFLGKLDPNLSISKNHIVSLLKYKKDNNYLPISEGSFSNLGRVKYTEDQKKLYDTVKMA
jgi:hypothetical protein